ncbi:DUF1203 domain-containing protein [Shimia sp. R11_0]|uniref:DUF1203 domain-containing protein n=1 Tax=Shimia sp. R11_0 TaxID=2821096 RepID=UPI001ADC6D73|nr:DUF1203 domain-containing protein [Shimia sp. R11_0]MBO9479031.1 DUF1203 domain-containing protein [Shimia sp. R11_0]
MTIQFHPLPRATVAAIRDSRIDSYGNPVEHAICDGPGHPCRSCLTETAAGQPFLTLAHRPFKGQNAFTETGPIYLCESCAGTLPSAALPAILSAPSHIVRGYSSDERIVYGTGQITPTAEISAYAASLLARDDIAFVDVRSASNNCFLCRIKPA